MKLLYKASIANDIFLECLGDESLGLKDGDPVIVQCEKYLDNVVIQHQIGEPIEDVDAFEAERAQRNRGRHVEGDRTPTILRKATEADLATIANNESMTDDAQNRTRERIRVYKLEMKLIHTHYSFDRKLLLFQFSAEGRVDFRELLRDLSSMFRSRVELRQVGVRDEASILGGVGTCGRPFCCAQFLHTFSSINVRMAKQQGIALNPQNISGACGRLKCCLAFEAEYYKNNPVKKEKNTVADEMTEGELAALEGKSEEGEKTNRGERRENRGRNAGQNNGRAAGQNHGPKGQPGGRAGKTPSSPREIAKPVKISLNAALEKEKNSATLPNQ